MVAFLFWRINMDVYTLVTDKQYLIIPLSKITRVSIHEGNEKQVIILHDNNTVTNIHNDSKEDARKLCNILYKGMLDVKSN